MNNRFTIQIRGHVNYASEQALTGAMAQFLAQYPAFHVGFKSVEVWVDNEGYLRVVDGNKNRFTIQLKGFMDAQSEDVIETLIQTICTQFPEFTLSWKSIEVWANYDGSLRQFNDDGSEYIPQPEQTPVTEVVLEDADKIQIEEVEGI